MDNANDMHDYILQNTIWMFVLSTIAWDYVGSVAIVLCLLDWQAEVESEVALARSDPTTAKLVVGFYFNQSLAFFIMNLVCIKSMFW